MTTLAGELAARPYPGRGLVLFGGATPSVVYFLTGRSAASRSRELVQRDGGVDVVAAGDAAADDPLRHYRCYAAAGTWRCVGNGAQVPAIATDLAGGASLTDALARHKFEPDSLYTPRISLAWQPTASRAHLLANTRLPSGAPLATVSSRDVPAAGTAMLLCTYAGADPATVEADGTPVECAHDEDGEPIEFVWSRLDPALRVAALAVRLDDGTVAATR